MLARALVLLLWAFIAAAPLESAARDEPRSGTYRLSGNVFINFRPQQLIAVSLLLRQALPRLFAAADARSENAFMRVGSRLSISVIPQWWMRDPNCSTYFVSIDTHMFDVRGYLEIGVINQRLDDGEEVTLFMAGLGSGCLPTPQDGAYSIRLYHFDWKDYWQMTLSDDLKAVSFAYAGREL